MNWKAATFATAVIVTPVLFYIAGKRWPETVAAAGLLIAVAVLWWMLYIVFSIAADTAE